LKIHKQANAIFVPTNVLAYAKKETGSNVVNALLDLSEAKSKIDGTLNLNVYNPVISRRFKQAIVTYKAAAPIPRGGRLLM